MSGRVFGEIPGHLEGSRFGTRAELSEASTTRIWVMRPFIPATAALAIGTSLSLIGAEYLRYRREYHGAEPCLNR
jgi:hypothetical protein